MPFFKKKSVTFIKSILLQSENAVLYNGPFQELPFSEELIIAKSIHFYDDPAPCFIHRSAVRTRLLAEIEEELLSQNTSAPISGCLCPVLNSYFEPGCIFTALLTVS